MKKIKHVVGWCERVGLPDLGVKSLRVKLDTGARTSALHAEDIVIVRNRKTGLRFVRFNLFPRKKRRVPLAARAPLLGFKKVRSSIGQMTTRPVISTSIQLGEDMWPIEVTLVNRDIMGFRMLLGRTALQHGFVIDPSRTYLLDQRHPTFHRRHKTSPVTSPISKTKNKISKINKISKSKIKKQEG